MPIRFRPRESLTCGQFDDLLGVEAVIDRAEFEVRLHVAPAAFDLQRRRADPGSPATCVRAWADARTVRRAGTRGTPPTRPYPLHAGPEDTVPVQFTVPGAHAADSGRRSRQDGDPAGWDSRSE
jgi:hypothetical protein